MPVPPRRLKELIEGTVDHHASQRWPALEEVTITWRGSYGYLTGYLSDNDHDQIKLCRIQYLGDPMTGRSRSGRPAPTATPLPSCWTAASPATPAKPSTLPAPSTSPTPASTRNNATNPSRTSAGLH
jgi:hypothetical protein